MKHTHLLVLYVGVAIDYRIQDVGLQYGSDAT